MRKKEKVEIVIMKYAMKFEKAENCFESPENLLESANGQFIYGNYRKYYRMRLEDRWNDPRIKAFTSENFLNKKVLDIGCNDGTLTLQISLRFFPLHIVGIDVDDFLISMATKNLKYLERKNGNICNEKPSLKEKLKDFPICFLLELGLPPYWAKEYLKNDDNPFNKTIDADNINEFPNNVSFRVENFLRFQSNEKFETITCFSVTKWIHLNWGDFGIERLFQKIDDYLKPGGLLILEPQEWRSYKKRKYMSPKFKQNYKDIELRPCKFPTYLQSKYGYTLEETKGTDDLRFIKRKIYFFRKP